MKIKQNEHRHYKMYKAGRQWLIGSITVAGVALTMGAMNAKADTTTAANGTEPTTTETVKEKSAAEPTASATTVTKVPKATEKATPEATNQTPTPKAEEVTPAPVDPVKVPDKVTPTTNAEAEKTVPAPVQAQAQPQRSAARAATPDAIGDITIKTHYYVVDKNGNRYYKYVLNGTTYYTIDKALSDLHGGELYSIGMGPDTVIGLGNLSLNIDDPTKLGSALPFNLANFKLYGSGSLGDLSIINKGVNTVGGLLTALLTNDVAFYFVRQLPITINYLDENNQPISTNVSSTLNEGDDVLSHFANLLAINGYTLDFENSNLVSTFMDGTEPSKETLRELIDFGRTNFHYVGTDAEVLVQMLTNTTFGSVDASLPVSSMVMNYVYKKNAAVDLKASLSGTITVPASNQPIILDPKDFKLTLTGGIEVPLLAGDLQVIAANTAPGTYKVQLTTDALTRLKLLYPLLDLGVGVDVTATIIITGPTNPTDPTGPTNPTDPTGPTNPTDPTGPTNPTNPTGPTNPGGSNNGGGSSGSGNGSGSGSGFGGGIITDALSNNGNGSNGGMNQGNNPTFLSDSLSNSDEASADGLDSSDANMNNGNGMADQTGHKKENDGNLPQTNEDNNKAAGFGLAAIFTGMMTALGFGLRRKKKSDE